MTREAFRGARLRAQPGENSWITLRAAFEPHERKLVSSRPQLLFRPTRLVTPVGALRFIVRGQSVPPGAEVNLPREGVQFAHVGDLVVFEVFNDGNTPEQLETRVYGVAVPASGEPTQESLGEVGVPGASGPIRASVPSFDEEEEDTKP